MTRHFYIILFLLLCLVQGSYSQKSNYIIKRCSFNSTIDDEFSPVFYKGDLVYCSNLRDNSPVSYKNGDERLFNIVYVSSKGKSGWNRPRFFSKDLVSRVNAGPATFSHDGSLIYYERNIILNKNMKNRGEVNKMGIYRAEVKGDKCLNISLLSFDNPEYNFCTPSISPDGSRIYFASDMPGGYGGMDLYYCDSINGAWDKPVNLGPVINTPSNESFPFAAGFDVLYFSSDGRQGLGGKDIYYTREYNGKWVEPVHLDSEINSPFDDFGLIADSTLEQGYFSSNRLRTDDIFIFRSAPVEFSSCDSIRDNKYCFTFYDEKHSQIDTLQAIYVWDFGEGVILKGQEVKYCFPGPGKYSVSLSIYDAITGDTIAQKVKYDVDLYAIDQPDIKSYDIGLPDRSITFSGTTENLKGESITGFYWNFGSGFLPGGPSVTHTFKKEGEYIVKLGLTLKGDTVGNSVKRCVMKKIRVCGSAQELTLTSEGKSSSGRDTIENNNPRGTYTVLPVVMSDLTQHQRQSIVKHMSNLKDPVLKLNPAGLDLSSKPTLDNIVSLLKENPDLRIDIIIHSDGPVSSDGKFNLSQRLAQELAFYFKNEQFHQDRLRSYSAIDKSLLSNANPEPDHNNNVAELVFMKK
jgi:PKD repeat protein